MITSLAVLSFCGTSTGERISTIDNFNSKQFQTSLYYLDKINLTQNKNVLNIGYGQEDLNAYIARNYVSKGFIIGIDPDEKKIKRATQDYSGIENLHMIHMDALCFDFNKELDMIICPFSEEWTHDINTIAMIITNVTQSLKTKGEFYLWLDDSNDNCSLIVAALIDSNNYSQVTYKQNSKKKTYAIKATKK